MRADNNVQITIGVNCYDWAIVVVAPREADDHRVSQRTSCPVVSPYVTRRQSRKVPQLRSVRIWPIVAYIPGRERLGLSLMELERLYAQPHDMRLAVISDRHIAAPTVCRCQPTAPFGRHRGHHFLQNPRLQPIQRTVRLLCGCHQVYFRTATFDHWRRPGLVIVPVTMLQTLNLCGRLVECPRHHVIGRVKQPMAEFAGELR